MIGERTIPVLEDLEVEGRESGKVFGLYADGKRIGDDLPLAFNAKK